VKVLVPVEDIFFGSAVASFIARHQWPADTEFRILNVVDPYFLDQPELLPFGALFEYSTEEIVLDATEIVKEVAQLVKEALPQVNVTHEVIKGYVYEDLIAIAKDWQADMIVAGSHGRSGFSRFFLGSTSLILMSQSPCPVLLVKPDSKTLKLWDTIQSEAVTVKPNASNLFRRYNSQVRNRILIAVDETDMSDQVLDFVINHHWVLPANFKLLSVAKPANELKFLPIATLSALYQDAVKVRTESMRTLAVKLRDHYHLPNVEEEILQGDPKKTIVEAAKEWKADLIVVGCHVKEPLQRLFVGSVSLAVLCSAPCSVLLLRQASQTGSARTGSPSRQDEAVAVFAARPSVSSSEI
jgi:nucleotide-binding universal stress UspA family protein